VADAEHSRADVVSSLAVLIGLILTKFYPSADSILAILVALYIFYEAIEFGRESIDSLVDKANPEIEQKIKAEIRQLRVEIKEIKTRKIGTSNFAEISLLFDSRDKASEISQKTDKIESILLDKIPELKQISINVKSHDIKRQTTKSFFFGRRFRYGFGRGIKLIGPEKPKDKKKIKRIVIPLENNDIAPEFGSEKYLILDVDENNNIVTKEEIKNPYFETGGAGHGAKFIKSVSAEKVITKHIGELAKINLQALGIEIELTSKDDKIEKLLAQFKNE
jgi:predicted Fe-Mo cluster-binding NifX family protein